MIVVKGSMDWFTGYGESTAKNWKGGTSMSAEERKKLMKRNEHMLCL